MPTTLMRSQPLGLKNFFTHWIGRWFVALALAGLAGQAVQAAPPPAGTSISNQASASYSDVSGVTRTVTSNVVQTTVTQVSSLTLVQNGAQNATPGSVVYYPHTLTNTGNGIDTFSLATSNTGGFTMAGVQIFADNGSGQPTGPALVATGPVAANASFKFIAAGTLPASATSGQANTITVTASSSVAPKPAASNTDVTTVTSNAVITLTKAVSAASGAPGSGPVTYSLTYTNTGNSTATSVVISDTIPAQLTYLAGSARWSATGTTALSDSGASSGTSPNTLTSGYVAGTTTFAATLAQVMPGQSGMITFSVNVAAAAAPGARNNTATTSYNNGAATVTGSSNTVPFTVTQSASVTFTGPVPTPSAAAGSTLSFANLVTNTGSGTDSFNIALASGNSFPSGTTFQLYKSDGVTPLVDTNSDGMVDTGPLAAGATYSVILKAMLPPGAPAKTTASSVSKTATSVFDSSRSATATDTLSAITGASVDLRNASATGTGAGMGPESAAQATSTVAPGASTAFTLAANNTGTTPDSYSLAASTDATFGTTVLPAGWTVVFRAGDCAAAGATLANTGSVAAGGSTLVCATVTVPAGFPAATSDLYFRTLSPASGATDTLHDAVTVSAARSITVTPNGAGQTFPGGSYVYSHTVTNNGNVTEGNGAASTIAAATANNQAGWSSALFFDANGNGVLDASDPIITGNLHAVAALAGGLAPGQSITVFNRVISPSGAVAGAVNATTLTLATANGTYTSAAPAPAVATDSTTVIAGNLTLAKAQALDAACTGATGATAYASANLGAKPNECVLYQITVTNVGSANATAVVASDATPAYTTLSSAPATTVGAIAAGAPAVGGTGTVAANVGTLTPGQAAVFTFGVRITP